MHSKHTDLKAEMKSEHNCVYFDCVTDNFSVLYEATEHTFCHMTN